MYNEDILPRLTSNHSQGSQGARGGDTYWFCQKSKKGIISPRLSLFSCHVSISSQVLTSKREDKSASEPSPEKSDLLILFSLSRL